MAGIATIADVQPATLARFDAIIDVRSPAEFAEDHLPGAINLPVLSNKERAEVGTIYVQQSRFTARRIGGAYVAANIARHLQDALADKDGAFSPLVYCWRGGMRSGAMATILDQVGWRTAVLAGGYKTYRRLVQERLYGEATTLNIVLLDGDTGSGKTAILNRLEGRGVQTLDLEALAGHRGSLFGALPGQPQPSQRMFESRLLAALDALDPARPVVVEAESSKVGERMIPPMLWQAMRTAPRIEVQAPRPERARYLVEAYADITADPAALDAVLERLPVHPAQRRLADWRAMAAAGRFAELAEALMEFHYDPAYRRAARKHGAADAGVVSIETLDPAGLDHAAVAVARLADACRPARLVTPKAPT